MSWSGHDEAWSSPPPRFDAQAQTSAFSADGREIEYTEPAKPPLLWLGISVGLSVVALVLALVGRGATMGLVAWVLAGPLAIGMLGQFMGADAKRREDGWYAPSALAEWGQRLAVVLALVAVACAAWMIAGDVARGMWT